MIGACKASISFIFFLLALYIKITVNFPKRLWDLLTLFAMAGTWSVNTRTFDRHFWHLQISMLFILKQMFHLLFLGKCIIICQTLQISICLFNQTIFGLLLTYFHNFLLQWHKAVILARTAWWHMLTRVAICVSKPKLLTPWTEGIKDKETWRRTQKTKNILNHIYQCTFVAEKSTLCRNLQFFPSACKLVSVTPKQPLMLIICSSLHCCARATIPSSEIFLHLLRHTSAKWGQDEAMTFRPAGTT